MQHHRIGLLVAGLVTWTVNVSSLDAQIFVHAGGGATLPVGTFGEYAKPGWMVIGGVGVAIASTGLSVSVDAMYGGNHHKDLAGDRTLLPGVLGRIQYRPGDANKARPYFLITSGSLNHKFKSKSLPDLDEDVWESVYGIGAGVDIPMRRTSIFLETRYMTRASTSFFPFLAGVKVPIGGKH